MKKIYFFLLYFIIGVGAASAQLNYQTANGVNTTTTYSSISATGTTITTANTDDANSSPVNIGFTFNFNGTAFTQFIFNTNGFIKLGATAPTSAAIFGSSAQVGTGNILLNSSYPANGNSIAVLNHDLDGTATTEYKVLTSGTAPNRVCTIEWKDVTEKTTTPAVQYSTMNFQIKLYETSNNIELIYGTWTATANADAFKTAAVGIVGTDNTGSNVIMVTKGSTAVWSGAVFSATQLGSGQIFNFRRTVGPDAGRTYRFVSTLANDAQVTGIHTLGKIAIPSGTPHVVRATIKNIGSNTLTNLNVNLNITGTNPHTDVQTIASLAPGAATTVSFSAYTPTTHGSSVVTVSIPSDDNTANNSANITQQATPNVYSTAYSTAVGGVGSNTGTIDFAVKFLNNGVNTVTQVTTYFFTAGQPYTVSIFAGGATPGASLWTSASQTSTAGANNITVPNIPITGDFYVGVTQTTSAVNVSYGYELENPIRSEQFFLRSPAGTGTWSDFSVAGANFKIMMDATLGASLPVTFVSFNGSKKDNGNLLGWSTANENNNRGFDIERSVDGRNFTSIAFQSTKAENGNSSTVLNYSYLDSRPFAGANFYRLKQIDKDGTISYSVIIKIDGDKNGIQISSVYPNPVRETLNLAISSAITEKATIIITDLTGKLVSQMSTALIAGENIIPVNVSTLSAGSYHVRVICPNAEVKTSQFIKN